MVGDSVIEQTFERFLSRDFRQWCFLSSCTGSDWFVEFSADGADYWMRINLHPDYLARDDRMAVLIPHLDKAVGDADYSDYDYGDALAEMRSRFKMAVGGLRES